MEDLYEPCIYRSPIALSGRSLEKALKTVFLSNTMSLHDTDSSVSNGTGDAGKFERSSSVKTEEKYRLKQFAMSESVSITVLSVFSTPG